MSDIPSPQTFGVTRQLFDEWRSPRYGKTNPEKVESPVWEWLTQSKLSGYASAEMMKGPSPFDEGPTWSFDRFGQSETKLEDGRTIYIAGEHEDHYDPDFFIYNDVVVRDKQGNYEFYCFPESIFPPTDFHSATLIGDKIVLIGSLGYPEKREQGKTQVAILDLAEFAFSLINVDGEHPGWIHDHEASFDPDSGSIRVTKGLIYEGEAKPFRENIDDWSLDCMTWSWTRLTDRKWPQIEITRKDKTRNFLWEIRQALWSLNANWVDDHQRSMDELESSLGHSPDLNIINDLYKFDFEHTSAQEHEEEHNVYSIYADEIKIRFIEDGFSLKVVAEGNLSQRIVEKIEVSLVEKLSRLENTDYYAERL